MANEQDRSQVSALAATVQEVTGDAVAIALADRGYTGAQATQDAEVHHIHLEVDAEALRRVHSLKCITRSSAGAGQASQEGIW